MDLRQSVLMLVGMVESLLLVRLVLRLLAARPDHLVMSMLLELTAPLIAPLSFLDAGQPRFGAALEFSTLALLMLLPVFGLGIAWFLRGNRSLKDTV